MEVKGNRSLAILNGLCLGASRHSTRMKHPVKVPIGSSGEKCYEWGVGDEDEGWEWRYVKGLCHVCLV